MILPIVALLNSPQQFISVSLVSNSTYFFIMAGMSSDMLLAMYEIGVGLSMACTLISWVAIATLLLRILHRGLCPVVDRGPRVQEP